MRIGREQKRDRDRHVRHHQRNEERPRVAEHDFEQRHDEGKADRKARHLRASIDAGHVTERRGGGRCLLERQKRYERLPFSEMARGNQRASADIAVAVEPAAHANLVRRIHRCRGEQQREQTMRRHVTA